MKRPFVVDPLADYYGQLVPFFVSSWQLCFCYIVNDHQILRSTYAIEEFSFEKQKSVHPLRIRSFPGILRYRRERSGFDRGPEKPRANKDKKGTCGNIRSPPILFGSRSREDEQRKVFGAVDRGGGRAGGVHTVNQVVRRWQRGVGARRTVSLLKHRASITRSHKHGARVL